MSNENPYSSKKQKNDNKPNKMKIKITITAKNKTRKNNSRTVKRYSLNKKPKKAQKRIINNHTKEQNPKQ